MHVTINFLLLFYLAIRQRFLNIQTFTTLSQDTGTFKRTQSLQGQHKCHQIHQIGGFPYEIIYEFSLNLKAKFETHLFYMHSRKYFFTLNKKINLNKNKHLLGGLKPSLAENLKLVKDLFGELFEAEYTSLFRKLFLFTK